jgi:hypothetical protein
VYGENGGIVAYSADSRITNDGSIYAGITAAGVTLGGIGEGRSHLVNRGVISGDYGVQVNLPTEEQSLVTTETVVVTNYGSIVGTFAGYAGGANVDQFINRGTVKGNIGLQGGTTCTMVDKGAWTERSMATWATTPSLQAERRTPFMVRRASTRWTSGVAQVCGFR